MILREARKDEIQQLQDLKDKAFADNPNFDPDLFLNWAQSDKGKRYFTNLLINSDTYCLVAEDDGKLIGHIAAAPKHFDDRIGNYIEIENLGVIPEYRLQGIGNQFMEKCITWEKQKGYKKAYLKCYF